MKSQEPTGNGLSPVASCAPQTSSSKAKTGLHTVTLGLPRPGGELQIIQSHAPERQLMVARAREEETHKLTKTHQAQSVLGHHGWELQWTGLPLTPGTTPSRWWHSWREGILARTPLLYFLVVQIFYEAAGTPNKKRGLT